MSDPSPLVAAEQAPPLVPSLDPVLLMIERASRDTTVDIAKFKELWAMRKERQAEVAEAEFNAAFAALMPTLPVIDQKGRIKIYAKVDRDKPGGPTADDEPIQVTPYSKFEDILETVRGPLAEAGFGIRFEFDTTPVGESYRIVATAILMHRGGHSTKASTPPLVHDATGSKNAVQAVGSTLSYAKRYALMAVLPIVSHAPEDADDDATAAGLRFITMDEIFFLQQALRDTESDEAKFLETMGVATLAEITPKQLKRAKALLAEKKRRASAGAKSR